MKTESTMHANHEPMHHHGAVQQADAAGTTPGAGTIYTCPMHPQIRKDHPGSCPICGMTLEPVMPTLDEAEDPELTSFRHRFRGRTRRPPRSALTRGLNEISERS